MARLDLLRRGVRTVGTCVEHCRAVQLFNGSDQPVSMHQLAEQVIAIAGSSSPIEFQSYTDAYDRDFEAVGFSQARPVGES